MGKVLIIDDDELMSKALSSLIERLGHYASYATTLGKGLEQAKSEQYDVIVLDVRMPDGNGLSVLPKLVGTPSGPDVLILTAAGDPDGAELAIKCGAWDYIEKSPSIKDMMLPLSRVFQYRKEKVPFKSPVALKRDKIVGSSPKIKACLDLVAQAAAYDVNVLITGETGTGKELFARAIHENSPRDDTNFVVVDCTALPQNLVESALFGHKKGAFTGADQAQDGLIAQADGGTLFLDEIGELPKEVQIKLLRVLQERQFRPVGGTKERRSDFRLIAATNRDLDHMVEEGTFRNDLLFRLRALTIELPPLCERPEDIVELTHYHIARLCDRYNKACKGFVPEFLESLKSYGWPGNVRELVNTLDGAITLAGNDPTLYCQHLPMPIRVQMARQGIQGISHTDSGSFRSLETQTIENDLPTLKDVRESIERDYLQRLIQQSQQDLQEACRVSGLSRSRLYELLKKYDLSLSSPT
jgi:two-component system NtrC family response regulator